MTADIYAASEFSDYIRNKTQHTNYISFWGSQLRSQGDVKYLLLKHGELDTDPERLQKLSTVVHAYKLSAGEETDPWNSLAQQSDWTVTRKSKEENLSQRIKQTRF